MPRARYLPDNVSAVVKDTGAHFMCILSKAAARNINVKEASTERLRSIAEECVREEKLVPVRKFMIRLGLVPTK